MGTLNSDTERFFSDFVKLAERWLIAVWNFLMEVFVAVKLMPLFARAPWLLAVLLFFLCRNAAYCIFLGLFRVGRA